MASDRERRYWDSFCFIAVLNNEEPYASTCAQILDEAKKNRIELVISPMTMAETVRPRGRGGPIPIEQQERIADWFENDYMRFRVIDRLIAKRSLSLCWNAGLHPRDALHVAVALECVRNQRPQIAGPDRPRRADDPRTLLGNAVGDGRQEEVTGGQKSCVSPTLGQ